MVQEKVEVEDTVTAWGVAVPLLSEGAGVTVWVPVGLKLEEKLPLGVPLLLTLLVAQPDPARELLPDAVPVGHKLGEKLPLGVPLREALALGAVDTVARLREGEAVVVRAVGSEGDAVAEGERLRVAHAVGVVDDDAQCEGEGDAEAEEQPEALGLPLSLALPLALPDAPAEALSEFEAEAQREGLDVELRLGPARPGEPEVLGDTLREREPVALLQAVADTLLLRVGLPDVEAQGVVEAEGEYVAEEEADPHTDSLALPVLLALKEGLPLAQALALSEGGGEGATVADTERQEEAVRLGEDVCERLTVPQRLTVGLRVMEAHTLREGVPLRVLEALALAQPVTLAQPEAEVEADREPEGEEEALGEALCEGEPVALTRALVREARAEAELEGDALREREPLEVTLRERVTLTVAEAQRVEGGVAVREVVALAEPVAMLLRERERSEVREPVALPVAVPVPVADADAPPLPL
jgi:hypothetical protein